MGQVSRSLRRAGGGYVHWCPGCEEVHRIPDSWTFNGDIDCPTFNPSVKITGVKAVVVDGRWNGEFVRDAEGKPVPQLCHYFLHAGKLQFCGDSQHAFAGKTVDLPELPEGFRDEDWS